jgi:large subunit ribosomal protein L10
VPQITDLRRQLREAGIEYRVVKNTLLRLAAEKAGRQQFLSIVEGPTAIAFAADPMAPVKVLESYVRTGRTTLALRGALIGDRVYGREDTLALATLPPREVLLGQALGTLQAPLARFVGVLQASLQGLVGVLEARRQQLAEGA